MQTIQALPVSSDALPAKPASAAHVPGPPGSWFKGNAQQLFPNPGPFLLEARARYGDVFSAGLLFNRRVVVIASAEHNRRILIDSEDNFSSRWGWDVVHKYFGRNVLVRDFADHRQHRKLMTQLFKPAMLESYLLQMEPLITGATQITDGEVDVYRHAKQLALDIAVSVFAGYAPGPHIRAMNDDLVRILDGVLKLPVPLPWGAYRQGLKARDRVRAGLLMELRGRRNGNGADLFSRLATAATDDGAQLSDSDVIDHMMGMLFAAHDTTASTMAMMCSMFAEHPQWQETSRNEIDSLHGETGHDQLAYVDLDRLPVLDRVIRETLRLYSPLQFVPRRAVRPFHIGGFDLPGNTHILLAAQLAHFDPENYPDPYEFNPDRFKNEPPPFAYLPFGRGSHMCIGMHFASMEIKAVFYSLLRRFTLYPGTAGLPHIDYMPVLRPQKAMKVRFESR